MTREGAIGNLIHAIRWNDMPKKEALDMAIQALEQEPKTGYWIVHEIEGTLRWLECSNCRCETSYNVMHNYCPNCGARMVEPQERRVNDK